TSLCDVPPNTDTAETAVATNHSANIHYVATSLCDVPPNTDTAETAVATNHSANIYHVANIEALSTSNVNTLKL
ncbi:MAG: hypothetical protein ACSHX8_15430, partial [Opitutaceae bacterium]